MSATVSTIGSCELSLQQEKVKRLRVNRIALQQSLRVEHVLRPLITSGVLTELDRKQVESAPTAADQVRVLLDLLPTKGKKVDWYSRFRHALRNPDVGNQDVRQKYQILVEFLDNTIVPKPKRPPTQQSDLKLPHYESLPSIGSKPSQTNSRVTFGDGSAATSAQGALESGASTTDPHGAPSDDGTKQDSGAVQSGDGKPTEEREAAPEPPPSAGPGLNPYVPSRYAIIVDLCPPPDFTSCLRQPTDHLSWLAAGGEEERHILEQEKIVWERVQALEVAMVLRKQFLLDGELCLLAPVEQFLWEEDLHHLALKYLLQFRMHYGEGFLENVTQSLVTELSRTTDPEGTGISLYLSQITFRLARLLQSAGRLQRAEDVLLTLTGHLASMAIMPHWMATWRALVQLMGIRRINADFRGVDWAHGAAKGMAHVIELVSFGKCLLDETDMQVQLSRSLLEQGSVGPAYSWAQIALRNVDPNDLHRVVDVLCTASRAYSAQWNLRRAQELASLAVQYARSRFGPYHPRYAQALRTLSDHLAEHGDPQMAVEVAERAVSISRLHFGCTALEMAQAHRCLVHALRASGIPDTGRILNHARIAWSAVHKFLDEDHPRRAHFKLTLAECLVHHYMSGPEEPDRVGLLPRAATEALQAVDLFTEHWGEYSLFRSKALVVSARIHRVTDRYEDAEKCVLAAYSLQRRSMPAHSHHLLRIKIQLAQFWEERSPYRAAEFLLDAIQNADVSRISQDWLREGYTCLVRLFHATQRPNEAEMCRSWMLDWIRQRKPEPPVTWEVLESEPPTYQDFLKSFDVWQERLNRIKRSSAPEIKIAESTVSSN